MANPRLSNGSAGSPPRLGGHALSWTDDLPVCPLSGVGFSTNQVYREDGIRREDHEFEDTSFHFRSDNDCFLYGVFDGHDGSKTAHFAAQRIPAELLLGQLSGKASDEQMKEVLYQAFTAVEKSFFESIDHIFAEKTTIQLQLPEGLNHYEACKQFPDVMSQLDNLEREITGGTTATVALIYNSKLYVANVDPGERYRPTGPLVTLTVMELDSARTLKYHAAAGHSTPPSHIILTLGQPVRANGKENIYNSKLFVANVGDTRALLCTTDEAGMLRVMQLSVDHSLMNEEELMRLAQLGLDVEQLKKHRRIGSSDSTRCIGDYHVKGGYKDIEILRNARHEPVIADPYVHAGIPIDSSSCFLIIMSDGLYQALQDATGCDRVNVEVARMVASEFSVQTTLNGVAQAVVDKVCRIHHDAYLTGTPDRKLLCQKRGDITLLVRNFSYPLAKSSPAGATTYHPVSVPLYQGQGPRINPQTSTTIPTTPNYLPLNHIDNVQMPSPVTTPTPTATPPKDTLVGTAGSTRSGDSQSNTSGGGTYASSNSASTNSASTNSTSTNSTQSSGETRFPSRYYKTTKLDLDADGKIEAYIDFCDFFKAIDELTEAQRESLNAETKPKSAYEPITEESEAFTAPEN